jgi:NAD(P)-dependent dehydrogenase (short-subunit alcohol dehydrogenase family)
MKADITPPVAIVTGAARRIGAAIAHRLAAEGFAVVLHTSPASKAEGEAEAARIRNASGRAIAAASDLAGVDPARDLFDKAEHAFGAVTLLVNNASLFEPDRAEDFSPRFLGASQLAELVSRAGPPRCRWHAARSATPRQRTGSS